MKRTIGLTRMLGPALGPALGLGLAALLVAGRAETRQPPAAAPAPAPAPATAPAPVPSPASPPASAASAPAPASTAAAVRAMYGGTPARNMVADETHLPSRWDPATGLNVKWVANLGSQSYGGPVVAGGQVYVGTNNQQPRDPKVAGDRGIIMAFRAADGRFLWQAVHDKLSQGKVNDWPLQGICSTPAIEGDRLYYVSNRAELVCAGTEGSSGAKHDGASGAGSAASAAADFVWKLDMIGQLGVYPHNQAARTPLVFDALVS